MDEEAQQQLAQLEQIIKSRFTKEALQRFGNIKAAYPEKASQVILILGQALQKEEFPVIDDQLLKQVLIRLQEKKEMNITRK
ncbi:hypothetical protein J4410_00355 [Candidatus Woesearchaeota archaeon]|nr:hypothetical protein [Candidatus Woesearchaeota archaeon]